MAENKRAITPYKGGRFKRIESRVTQKTFDDIARIVQWHGEHGEQQKFTFADWLEKKVQQEIDEITAPQPARKEGE